MVLPYQNCVEYNSANKFESGKFPPPSSDDQKDLTDPIRVKIFDSDVVEEDVIYVDVELSRPDVKNFIIHWETSDNSAIAGDHYFKINGRLVIEAGETTGRLKIPAILADEIDDLSLFVKISSTSKGVIDRKTADVILPAASAKYRFTQDNSVVSNFSRGRGPTFDRISSVTQSNLSSFAYLTDFAGDQIFRVNLNNGDRSLIKQDLPQPVSLAISSDEKRAYVISRSTNSIRLVNLANGITRGVSGTNIGQGPMFVRPMNIIVDPNEAFAYVADAGASALFRVDLNNGDRIVLSNENTGNGPVFSRPNDLAFYEGEVTALVTDGAGALFLVDLINGDRMIVSDAVTGLGVDLQNPVKISLSNLGKRIFVLDRGLNQMIEINRETGDRSAVITKGIDDARDFFVNRNSTNLFIIDSSAKSLHKFY